MKHPKRFGWIAAALADKGFQQADLARGWEVDDAVVTRFISTGKPGLTPERLIVLSRMLGMNYNELMVRMYENVGPRRVLPKARFAGTATPTKPNTVETLMVEIHERVAALRKLLPKGVRATFNIDYGDGSNK